MMDIIQELSDEADIRASECADGIAHLLNEAISEIKYTLKQIYDAEFGFGIWHLEEEILALINEKDK